MATPLLDDYRWLVSEAARPWLARAAEASDIVRLAKALRRDLSFERARLVAEQTELRRRARTKFSAAASMFLTARGLEQATSEAVARYKAQRLAGFRRVADLCCGIGGDLMALAAGGAVWGAERDPVTALLAAANAQVEVRECDARELSLADADVWHIDPDRRPGGRRTVQLDFCEPNGAAIDALRSRQATAAVKLAPASAAPPHWSSEAEREWISERGECKQQVCWFGRLAEAPGLRRATRLTRSGEAFSFAGHAKACLPLAGGVRDWIYEPDPAVRAASLTGSLAAARGLAAWAPDVPYLTGDARVSDALLTAFRVKEVMPFDVRIVRLHLRSRRVGRLEIKCRAARVDRRKLRELGGQHADSRDGVATLFIAASDGGGSGGTLAIVAERAVPQESA